MTQLNPSLSIESIEPWQWTAFALGELDPNTMEQMKLLIAQNPQLQIQQTHLTSFLEGVRSVVTKQSVGEVLLPEQSERIEAQLHRPAMDIGPVLALGTSKLRNRRRLIALLSTAAAIPMAYLGYSYWSNLREAARIGMISAPNGSSMAANRSTEGPMASRDESSKQQNVNSPLPSPAYLNDDVSYVPRASIAATLETSLDGARVTDDSNSMLTGKPEGLPDVVQLETNLSVPDGGTIVLGGIRRQRESLVPAPGEKGTPFGTWGAMGSVDATESSSRSADGDSKEMASVATGPIANYAEGASSGGQGKGDGLGAGKPEAKHPQRTSLEGAPTAGEGRALPDDVASSDSLYDRSEGESSKGVHPDRTNARGGKDDPVASGAGAPGAYGGTGGGRAPGGVPTGGVPQQSQYPILNRLYRAPSKNELVKDAEGKETSTLMMTITPRVIIPEEEEEFAAVAARDKVASLSDSTSGRGAEETLRQVPAELKQNVPHLFGNLSEDRRTSGDRFEPIHETPFARALDAQLSTFSIDVDTASYAKIRQYLMQSNTLPNPNMVRIEEMVNYFDYEYKNPDDEDPFAADMAVTRCPWNTQHKLVRIGLQAKKVQAQERPSANLVFLIDVSGSMNEPNKLPLVKKTLSMLVEQLQERDRVAIVVYAGAAGCVLPSTLGTNKRAILESIDHLNAGGSTNGGQGIQLAYSIAREQFVSGGINRVILCTDGDFNVGVTSNDDLIRLMQENAKSKVFFTCLGYGVGNYNDSMMEQISDKGNGVYGMIDSEREARKMMVEQLSGTLMTVAKDVKIQVEFNPQRIAGYRLIGYENRRLANRDFNDDRKDAGEVGAGHRVTALYEIIPAGRDVSEDSSSPTDDLRYRKPAPRIEQPVAPENAPSSDTNSAIDREWLTLKLRYKHPEGDVSTKREFMLNDRAAEDNGDSRDLQWATAVAEFGLLLRNSRLAPQADWGHMLERAETAAGNDARRQECVQMMQRARTLADRR